MVKTYSAVILLFLLMPVDLSFAQTGHGGIKIYSGYLHHNNIENEMSFWCYLFTGASPGEKSEAHYRQCSIVFKSPTPFSHQSVDILPEQMAYIVSFKDELPSSGANSIKLKDAFEKYIIKIYADDQVFTVDPEAEDQQVGINEEHHIFDPYLIYLILGTKIDHLEIVSASGSNQDKYILDKLEVRNDRGAQ